MKNYVEALKTIYDNIPMILTIIMLIVGIVLKVRKFFRQTKEEQQRQLKEQSDKLLSAVKKKLLVLVSDAEKKWGGGTGTIKKSEVWGQLMQNQQLQEFIAKGLIAEDMVDEMIDSAVEQMKEIMEKNQKAKDAIAQ